MKFLNNISVRTKLLLISTPLMIALILAVILMGVEINKAESELSGIYFDVLYSANNSLLGGDRDFYQSLLAATQHHMLASSDQGISAEDSAALIEDYESNADQVYEKLHAACDAAKADDKLFREMKTASGLSYEESEGVFDEHFNKWKSLYDVKNDSGDWDAFNAEFEETRNVLDELQDLTESWAQEEHDLVRKQMMNKVIIIAIAFAVLIGILVALIVAVIRGIRKGIQIVTKDLNEMANGNLAITPIDVSRLGNDEISQIVVSSQTLVERLAEIIGNIKVAAQTVDNSSTELAETADQISRNTEGISEAVNGIATGAVQQAEEIQNANVNVERISDAVGNVTNNTEELETTTDQMNNESQQAVSELERLRTSAAEMSRSITDITECINATSSAVTSINDKVAAITSIATQTNLLALNASIEAARAGDAGRGFAVVAEEIGKLADDSAMSAGEIRKEMELLLEESQTAVRTAQEVQKTNEAQQNVIANTVEVIQMLIDAIGTTVSGVGSINMSAKESEEAKIVVIDAMSSLSAISEENAAATEETSAAMEELNATVAVLAESAEQLQMLSRKLAEDVSFFR
ncbi:MAG: hypothetical protein J5842_07970 [Lachnospiraceae bacterium]|nr:hypothetical protein [Lachnospiraceae bacterium]